MNKGKANGKKRWIRPLPERLVNKIAAGEVIDRPANVLKELVENAIDADADRIDIIIEKSGTKRITIIDNGCGIDTDQVEIAFSRHATSKIGDFRDFDNLLSYGFRGEALPSISSISKTTLTTKTADSDAGTEIIIEGGVVQSVKQVSAPSGTKVEVENLFFNTPARRKFLKSEATEAQHLTRYATALALGAPGIDFSYGINGRKLFALTKTDGSVISRVAGLLLSGDIGQLLEVKSESDGLEIAAYLSYPLYCRRNQQGLYIFINGRYIRSQSIVHGVTSGYAELLERGRYPVGAVFLTVDPADVDVNVHPTKAEVRLSDERKIHDMLYHAIKRSLRESRMLPTPDLRPENAGQINADQFAPGFKSFVTTKPTGAQQTALRELYHTDSALGLGNNADAKNDIERISSPANSDRPKVSSSADDPDIDSAFYLGQFGGLYLLFSIGDRLFIVDQHAAHERILYEENLRVLDSGGGVSQNLLFPVNLEMAADEYSLYEDAVDSLRAVGFSAEPFGPRAIILSAVPSVLSKQSPEKVFREVMADIHDKQRAGRELTKAIAQSVACRAAVMSGDRISEAEAVSLLKQLYRCENRHSCPHGRPTFLKITKNELEIRFGRK